MSPSKARGMGCQGPRLVPSQRFRDHPHLAERVVVAAPFAPGGKLRLKIGGRLAGERRIPRPHAFARHAVAFGARRERAPRVALGPKAPCRHIVWRLGGGQERAGKGRGKRGIIGRDLRPVGGAELFCDGAHRFMFAASARIIVKLAVEIAGIESREPRGKAPVAFAFDAVAGETGGRGARVAAAHRNRLAGRAERIRIARRRVASRQGDQEEKGCGAHLAGTNFGAGWFPFRSARREAETKVMAKGAWIASMLVMLAACHSPAIEPDAADAGTIARGEAAAERLGCGACHAMPGIDWPKGRVGPPLDSFGTRAMVAGRLPNEAPLLAQYVGDAPALVPGSAMPAIPMTEAEARDIAAWLQSLRD